MVRCDFEKGLMKALLSLADNVLLCLFYWLNNLSNHMKKEEAKDMFQELKKFIYENAGGEKEIVEDKLNKLIERLKETYPSCKEEIKYFNQYYMDDKLWTLERTLHLEVPLQQERIDLTNLRSESNFSRFKNLQNKGPHPQKTAKTFNTIKVLLKNDLCSNGKSSKRTYSSEFKYRNQR